MDDDTTDLIARLCTRAAMIMEDASVIALSIGIKETHDYHAAIAELEAATIQITSLVNAATGTVVSSPCKRSAARTWPRSDDRAASVQQ